MISFGNTNFFYIWNQKFVLDHLVFSLLHLILICASAHSLNICLMFLFPAIKTEDSQYVWEDGIFFINLTENRPWKNKQEIELDLSAAVHC